MKSNDITRWRLEKLIGQEMQKTVAEKIGTTGATIGNYVNGKTKELSFVMIKKFAECFDVSIDYVVDVTDDKTEMATENDRIRFLCFVYKDSERITELSQKLGAKDLLHSHIRNEYEYFVPDKARAIAEAFGVDVEWFTNGRVANYQQIEIEQTKEKKKPFDLEAEFDNIKAAAMAEIDRKFAELISRTKEE